MSERVLCEVCGKPAVVWLVKTTSNRVTGDIFIDDRIAVCAQDRDAAKDAAVAAGYEPGQ